MALTSDEQHELDTLELQELESQEAQSPKSIWSGNPEEQAQAGSNMRGMVDQQLAPENISRLAGGLGPTGVSDKISSLGQFLGKAGGIASKSLGSGMGNDLLGVVSPRMAKLASFLKGAKEAVSSATPEAQEVAPKPNWTFPPVQKR